MDRFWLMNYVETHMQEISRTRWRIRSKDSFRLGQDTVAACPTVTRPRYAFPSNYRRIAQEHLPSEGR